MQHKMDSAIEATINIVIGFLISWAFWVWVVGPLLGLRSTAGQGFVVTTAYTFLSFFRQYFIRRWFNGKIIWERVRGAN